jgi:hypothetical protein
MSIRHHISRVDISNNGVTKVRKNQAKHIAAVRSFNTLTNVKQTRGGADRVPLMFRVKMVMWQKKTTFTAETRSVKIPNHNNRTLCIQLVSKRRK